MAVPEVPKTELGPFSLEHPFILAPMAGIAKNYPATMHLRVLGMNANGKVYAIDRAFTLNP